MKKRILVVDDSQVNRELLAELFEEDYEIIPAANGRQAMEILSIQLDSLATVLLDLLMPEVDGFAVLDYMKEKGFIEKLPVVVISSEESPETVERCYEYGISEFISKPFKYHECKATIEKVLFRAEEARRQRLS